MAETSATGLMTKFLNNMRKVSTLAEDLSATKDMMSDALEAQQQRIRELENRQARLEGRFETMEKFALRDR